jgi:hypothetical protein
VARFFSPLTVDRNGSIRIPNKGVWVSSTPRTSI